MDKEVTFKDFIRFLKYCPDGKFDCNMTDNVYDYIINNAREVEMDVREWNDENPPKTYLSELLKHFPNTIIGKKGVPEICPSTIGYEDDSPCGNCVKCWNTPIDN